MKTLLTLALMLFSTAAFAQDDMTCRQYTPETNICKFSGGRVNVTTLHDQTYSSTWYSLDEWNAVKALYPGSDVYVTAPAPHFSVSPVIPVLAPQPCKKHDKKCKTN